MVMSKRMMVVFGLCLLMACTVFVRETEANIHNGALGKGNAISCDPNNRKNCKEGPPANEYERGCNAMNRCRGGHGKKEDEEEDEKEDDKN
ncbi:hypothetical protein ACOSP7_002801 [Xanthoceras sorbifolium]